MKTLLFSLTVIVIISTIGNAAEPASQPIISPKGDIKSIPAIWHHDLSCTRLVGDKKGEQIIVSEIWTGILGKDAVIRHLLEVKVEAFGKPFSATCESSDKKQKEVLTVTLSETTNSKELVANFEHTVWEGKTMVLKFAGITRVVRLE